MKEFFQENSKKFNVDDMMFGGTPLHWGQSDEVLQALIELKIYEIDAADFYDRTALQIMSAKGAARSVLILVEHQAEINIIDRDGNTPLHTAVINRSISVVKTLVGLECELNITNKQEESALGKVRTYMVLLD